MCKNIGVNMQAPLVGYNPENGFELYRCFNYKPLKKYGVHCTAIVVGEIYIYIHTYPEPVCPLFGGFNPAREGPNSYQNRGQTWAPGIYLSPPLA